LNDSINEVPRILLIYLKINHTNPTIPSDRLNHCTLYALTFHASVLNRYTKISFYEQDFLKNRLT